MSDFMFGVSKQKPTRAQAKIMARVAKRHDACLIETTLPGTGYQRWYTARNYGAPFDAATARAVYADLVAAGVYEDNEDGEHKVVRS